MKENCDYNLNVGKYILVGELGLGLIKQTVDMGDRGNFYQVEFDQSKSSNYYSVNNPVNYRFVDSKEKLEAAIAIFQQEQSINEFKSSRAKIEFYQKVLKTNDVIELARHLSALNSGEEVHPGLNKLFNSSLKSFVLEIEFVFQCKNIEAWRMLGLNKNNK